MKRRIQAIRSRNQNGLINENNLSDLIVAEGFLNFELFDGTREDIIKYDSGPESGTDILIILSTDRNLEYLGETSEIFCDGTFKVAPPLFNQFYSIHGFVHDSVQPLVSVLLPGRSEAVYVRMIELIKNLVEGFNPADDMCDFEVAFINAVRNEIPGTSITGCFSIYARVFGGKFRDWGLIYR